MKTYFNLLALLLIVNQGYSMAGAPRDAAFPPDNGIAFTTKDPNTVFDNDVMKSFSGIHKNSAKTEAFKDYLLEKSHVLLSVPEVRAWYRNTTLPLPQNEDLQGLLSEFQQSGYKQYVQNLASFTGGGAKGMMEILAVVKIEEILNSLPPEVKAQIIERRVRRYLKNVLKTTAGDEDFINRSIHEIGELLKSERPFSPPEGTSPRNFDILHAIKSLMKDKYIYFQDVVDEFAGTSTGSIIAAGLAYMEPVCVTEQGVTRLVGFLRYKAYEVAQLYYRHLPNIFTSSGYCNVAALLGANYSKNDFQAMLRSFFGEKTFKQCFPNRNIRIFLTKEDEVTHASVAHVDDSFWGDKPVAVAVEGSSSAPTFFAPIQVEGRQFVDGGVRTNAPVAELVNRIQDKTKLLNVVSFGAGKELKSDAPKAAKGSALEAIGILSGTISGQVLEAHESCLDKLRRGEIRSFTHLNPVLLPTMKLDSVSAEFVKDVFNQTRKELETPILLAIMRQLLDFLPDTNHLKLEHCCTQDFEPLWERACNKVRLVDFTMAMESTQEPKVDTTQSQTRFIEVCQERFEAQRKWTKSYLDGLTRMELTKVLRATVDKDPFANFSTTDKKLDRLRDYLRKLYFGMSERNEAESVVSELHLDNLITDIKNHLSKQADFPFSPNFDLLPGNRNKISALTASNIANHAEVLLGILEENEIQEHNAFKINLVFDHYTQNVFSDRAIKDDEIKTILAEFDILAAGKYSRFWWCVKWLGAIGSPTTTSRGSAFRLHLMAHNERVEAKKLADEQRLALGSEPNIQFLPDRGPMLTAAATYPFAQQQQQNNQHRDNGNDDDDDSTVTTADHYTAAAEPTNIIDALRARLEAQEEELGKLRTYKAQWEAALARASQELRPINL